MVVSMTNEEKPLYILLAIIVVFFAAAGLLHEGPGSALRGLVAIQSHTGRLISDFTLIGGIGAAFLNASLMGAIALVIINITDVSLSGPTIAAFFTIVGFSLFGKTPLNTAPIMIGVYLVGRIIRKPFNNYILIALYGTALGPLTAYLAIAAGFSGIPALLIGTAGGLIAGFLLPALAMAMLRLHEGYNLYNIGLTCGFFGLFAASILQASGLDVDIKIIWNQEPSILLQGLVPALSILLIVWGLAMDGIKKSFQGLIDIQKLTGRLPSDFMTMTSPGSTLLNAGLLGLAGCLYIFVVGGDFNGPSIGGLFTLIGFATFGKHGRNTWPVAAGVIAATLLFGKSLSDPGPLLALLFGTTLAPLAGEFGSRIGFIAGFLHLVVVERTAAWHGGLDLYNNGFAGGLVATFMLAIIEWYRSNVLEKKPKKRNKS
ncbi:DUF1576 domain-containing protein [Treponema sp.]